MFREIKKNYFLLISIFLILYFLFNLLNGERGLFSYLKKNELFTELRKEEINLKDKINNLENKNYLLSKNIDLDYVETLIRSKFLFVKENETLYLIMKNND